MVNNHTGPAEDGLPGAGGCVRGDREAEQLPAGLDEGQELPGDPWGPDNSALTKLGLMLILIIA